MKIDGLMKLYLILLLVILCGIQIAFTQPTFTKITDAGNPIVSTPGPNGYSGGSWIDFDGDRDLDLFINNSLLFRNDGGGSFVQITSDLGVGQNLVTGNGNTWADYDNDGDLDIYISSANSFLYRNDGSAGGSSWNFTKIDTGDIGNGMENRGWSSAWGDFNNDGNVDLVITHPRGFVPGGPTPNHHYQNDGPPDYTFTRIDTGVIVTGLAPYTVGTWSDFDQDGDIDYFIGAGPANGTTAPDFLYRNLLVETGNSRFERITSGIIATEAQDGQVWNWIDYDNDGDLDAYLTNWGGVMGGMVNRLYRNDAGSFQKITSGAMVTDSDVSLSSVWGDFDNDGDLDCYVANDSGQPDRFYLNNGDGTFSSVTNAVTESLTRRGATAGDYNNDGKLDLLAIGPGSAMGLYRNDTQNTNSWINISCMGNPSNKAAVGTIVRAKAIISGNPVWQIREVQAQNNFNGQNSLRVHFGFGDATQIDTLIFEWPSGNNFAFMDVPLNLFYTAEEGQNLTPITSVDPGLSSLTTKFQLAQNYPNPFNPTTVISWQLAVGSPVRLTIFNLAGQRVAILIDEKRPAGYHSIEFNGTGLASGIYFYRLQAGENVEMRKMVLMK
jgi:hypothetical protein